MLALIWTRHACLLTFGLGSCLEFDFKRRNSWCILMSSLAAVCSCDETLQLEAQFREIAEDEPEALERMGLLNRSISPSKREGKSPKKMPNTPLAADTKPGGGDENIVVESESESSQSDGEMHEIDKAQVAGSNMGHGCLFVSPSMPAEVVLDEEEFVKEVDSDGVTVSGANMGMGGGRGGAAPVAKRKIKKRTSNYAGIEKSIQAARFKKDDYQIQMERMEAAEGALSDAREIASSMREPVPTLFMRFWDMMLWFSEGMLTDEERTARKPGHVRYSELITALMYWNKARNIVPSKDQEERKEFDEVIITEVAFQLIKGCINGGVVRWRKRKEKQRIRERFQRAKDVLGGKNKEGHKAIIRGALNMRQKKIAQAQDEYANPENMERLAADRETGPILSIVIKISNYKLATGSQLAREAQDCDFNMGKIGVFSLEESELETVFRSSHDLRTWARHVDAIEHLKWFVQEAVDSGSALVRLAARCPECPL
jgi:hypothetical protein